MEPVSKRVRGNRHARRNQGRPVAAEDRTRDVGRTRCGPTSRPIRRRCSARSGSTQLRYQLRCHRGPARLAGRAGRLGRSRCRGRAEAGRRTARVEAFGPRRGQPGRRLVRHCARATAAGSGCMCRRCSRRSARSSSPTTRATTRSAPSADAPSAGPRSVSPLGSAFQHVAGMPLSGRRSGPGRAAARRTRPSRSPGPRSRTAPRTATRSISSPVSRSTPAPSIACLAARRASAGRRRTAGPTPSRSAAPRPAERT